MPIPNRSWSTKIPTWKPRISCRSTLSFTPTRRDGAATATRLWTPSAGTATCDLQMYDSKDGTNAPRVGYYPGRTPKQINSGREPALPGADTSNRDWIAGAQHAGIQVDTILQGSDQKSAHTVHRN